MYSIFNVTMTTDNNLLEGAWSEVDTWFVTHVLACLNSFENLSAMPAGLGAAWINDTIKN